MEAIVVISTLAAAAGTTGYWMAKRRRTEKRRLYKCERSTRDFLLELVSDSVIFTNTSGQILHVSQAFQKILDEAGSGKLPEHLSDVFDLTSRHDYSNLLVYINRERKPVTNFQVYSHAIAGDKPLSLTIVPITGRNGTPCELVHVLRKQSQLLAPDLDRIEKLTNIGQIAAGMAHELNTPLGSIILAAEFIKDSSIEAGIVEEATMIKSRAEHCSQVVRDLLGYVRRDDQSHRSHCLLDIVQKVIDLMLAEAKRRNIRLSVVPDRGNISIRCNENQIEQLFFNLISNAFDASDGRGTVELSFDRDELLNRVLVRVADSGSGITAEHLEKIFDPFFTTKPGGQGTGLGLALCKKIVLEHGGDIQLSTVQGKGTTFEIAFPLDQ